MKYFFTIINLVFAMLLLSSCGKKVLPVKSEVVIKDSTTTVFNYRDTIIKRPAKVVKIHDTIPCPEVNYKSEKTDSTGKLKAKVTINKGVLDVECNEDSLQERISWLEKNQYTLKSHHEVKQVPYEVQVYKWYIPKWLLVLLAISIGLNIWCFRNPIKSFIKHFAVKW